MLTRVREVLEYGVYDLKAYPGAAAAVMQDGEVFALGVGRLTDSEESAAVTPDTVFDLASITKPVATVSAVSLLMQEGKVGLEDTLASWIPEAKLSPYADVTVEMLMAHAAGFPAWAPLFESTAPPHLGTGDAFKDYLPMILGMKPEAPPAGIEIYSDLDFMLLGRIVELASKKPFAKFVRSRVLEPLGLEGTDFLPMRGEGPIVSKGEIEFDDDEIAPTADCHWRKRRVHGEVDDLNAYALGGAAGHAGLFGTAIDLMAYALEVLDGLEGDGMLFEEEMLGLWLSRPFEQLPGSFTLGWDSVSAKGTLTGGKFGEQAIGHHGFTGTTFWIDPATGTAMALLTNRTYFPGGPEKINRIRPEFFNAAWEDLEKL